MAKKEFKISTFDIVVVVIVLIAGLLGYRFIGQDIGKKGTDTVLYTIELTDQLEGFSNMIEVGDTLMDNVKNFPLGTIVDVEVQPSLASAVDINVGMIREAVVEGRETVLITVEASVTHDEKEIMINDNFLIKSGIWVALRGTGFAGSGYILDVSRLEGD